MRGTARLAELVRERALEVGVQVRLSSGKRSDVYVDARRVTLHPEGLSLVARAMLDELGDFSEVSAVGGMTLGADPIAAAICALSAETDRPLRAFLVRKEAKGHGTGQRVEGELREGERVAILEDTLTTGASCLSAIEAVRELGAVPACVLVLVDREDPDADALRHEYEVRALLRLSDLLSRR